MQEIKSKSRNITLSRIFKLIKEDNTIEETIKKTTKNLKENLKICWKGTKV